MGTVLRKRKRQPGASAPGTAAPYIRAPEGRRRRLVPDVPFVGGEPDFVDDAPGGPDDPAHSIARIGFYARPEEMKENAEMITNVLNGFGEIIRDEDYTVAARSQLGADSGLQETVLFGRNEPALHHYHNTYRSELGMELLPLIEA